MKVDRLPGVGVEISEVDLACPSNAALAEVKKLFNRHGLVFFRGQSISETEHIEFAKSLGRINVNRFFAAHPDYPEIALVTKEPDQDANIGGGWHTDHSYDIEPALGSILVARELPESGGDTWFASMYRAYDSLSPGLRSNLERLSAVHSARHVFGSGAGYETDSATAGRIGNAEAADELGDPVHPVVITHPLSGRKALYVNPGFTLRFDGWTEAESAPLLGYLYENAADERYITRFHWEPGSIALWDNRATWHYALNDYQGMRREMHRITMDGCRLSPALPDLA